jgi:hypothetical protein
VCAHGLHQSLFLHCIQLALILQRVGVASACRVDEEERRREEEADEGGGGGDPNNIEECGCG